MHVQARSVSLNSVNPYSAASESAAAAQRAANVRKRQLKSSAIEAPADSEPASFLDHWMNSSPRNETEDEYRRADAAEYGSPERG
jgi:hypothetical protein